MMSPQGATNLIKGDGAIDFSNLKRRAGAFAKLAFPYLIRCICTLIPVFFLASFVVVVLLFARLLPDPGSSPAEIENLYALEKSRQIEVRYGFDLTLIRLLYGMMIALGLGELLKGFYDGSDRISARYKSISTSVTARTGVWLYAGIEYASFFCAGLGVSLIGLRFFWAVGNIRRFMILRANESGQILPEDQAMLVLLHYPAIILHGFLFFLLCRTYLGLSERRNFGKFSIFAAALFLTNIFWLATLSLLYEPSLPRVSRVEPEIRWIVINIVTLLYGVIVYYVPPNWLCSHKRSAGVQLKLLAVAYLLLANGLLDAILLNSWYMGSSLPDSI